MPNLQLQLLAWPVLTSMINNSASTFSGRSAVKGFLVSGLVAVCCISGSEARADTLSFEGLGNASVVTIGGTVSGTVWAGELNWEWLGTVPDGMTRTFYSYCVDVLNTLVNPQQVTVRSSTELSTPAVSDAGARAAWLFSTLADSIRSTADGIDAAALQVAIWEAIYDPTFDLNTGNFQLLTNAGVYGGQQTALSIFQQAGSYLDALQAASYSSATAVWIDAAVPGQDQITKVPEPASVALLGLGALLAARVGRARVRVR